MANNKIQVKRTSTSGRTPNTTNVANLQYIDAGELALNMADGILYSSNGSVLIPVGANNVNVLVSNTLTLGNSSINATVNSTTFSGTANNATNFGGYTWAAPALLGSTTANGASFTYANVSGQVNTATLYAATSANIASSILANSSGLYPTSNTVGFSLGSTTSRWTLTGLAGTFSSTLSVGGGTTLSSTVTFGGTGININAVALTTGSINFGGPTQTGSILLGQSTANQTVSIANGGTTSGNVKVLNIGTEGLAGSQTNITIGSSLSNTLITVNSNNTNFSGAVNATGIVSGSELTSTLASGDEGGQINLAKPPNGSTNGNIIIDAYQNRIRIYEAGGNNRGAYIDITAAANGVGSNLLTGGGGGGGTVTSVGSGNGLTGGPITGSGTLSVLANTGIIANATGLYVNATYIGTISANNASFLGGTAAASYVQNTDSRTLSGNLVISGTYFNPSANTILLGNSTQRWVISGNSGDFSSTVNAVTSVNSALLSVGTSFIANTTGAYHTGTVNAASITTTGVTVNAIGVYPTSNTSGQNLGTATQRFDAFLDTINVSDTITSNAGANAVVFTNATSKWIYFDTGGAGAPTTTNRSVGTKVVIWPSLSSTAVDYAIGTDNNILWYSVGQSTASHVWYANSTAILTANQLGLYHNATISGGSYIISSVYTANTTGIYHTGLVNAASYNIGSNFIANTTAVYFGTINATSNGSVLNATTLTIGNSSVNATVNSTTFSGTSNNASNLNGKTEANLNVNNATTAYGKTEGNLNVNSALTSNNASFLGGVAAASYVNTSGSYTLGGRLSFTAGANAILLTNSTSNWIYWADAGFEVPTFTTRSTGTKLVLYPALSGSQTDYALGIDGGVLWSSVPFSNSTYSFKWYGGVTEIASLSGAGNLLLSGSVNAASHTVGSSFIANSTAVVSTGFANIATSVNTALLTVGTSFIANTTGTYHTGVVNAASHTTTGVTANVTGVYPASNSTGTSLGGSTQRWALSANTIDITGNLTLSTASMIVANGAAGSNGQVLTSNGTTVYWSTAASGGSGGGYYYGSNGTVGDSNNKNNIFRVNANTLFANVTFIAGENGSAAGPIAINSGVFLTIEPGARVAIV